MRNNWHAISLEQFFSETGSSKDGLSSVEAAERLRTSGRNILPQEQPYSKIRLLIHQFNQIIL